MPQPILETVMFEGKLDIETDKGKLPAGVLARVKYPICNIDRRNHNKRKYPKKLWENVHNNGEVSNRLKQRNLWGLAEHPKGTTVTDFEKASHIVTELWLKECIELKEGKEIPVLKEYCTVDVLDTHYGRHVANVLVAGCGLGVSTRAEGELKEAKDDEGEYMMVDPDSYKFITVDFTADPSTFDVMPEDVQLRVTENIKEGVASHKMDKDFAVSILSNMHSTNARGILEAIQKTDGCTTNKSVCTSCGSCTPKSDSVKEKCKCGGNCGCNESSSTIKAFAKKADKSIKKVEGLWNRAKKSRMKSTKKEEKDLAKNDFQYITGTLKKMLNIKEASNKEIESIVSAVYAALPEDSGFMADEVECLKDLVASCIDDKFEVVERVNEADNLTSDEARYLLVDMYDAADDGADPKELRSTFTKRISEIPSKEDQAALTAEMEKSIPVKESEDNEPAEGADFGKDLPNTIESFEQIVREQSMATIGGTPVDMQSANIVVTIHDALSGENKEKFNALSPDQKVKRAWAIYSKVTGGRSQVKESKGEPKLAAVVESAAIKADFDKLSQIHEGMMKAYADDVVALNARIAALEAKAVEAEQAELTDLDTVLEPFIEAIKADADKAAAEQEVAKKEYVKPEVKEVKPEPVQESVIVENTVKKYIDCVIRYSGIPLNGKQKSSLFEAKSTEEVDRLMEKVKDDIRENALRSEVSLNLSVKKPVSAVDAAFKRRIKQASGK